MIHICYVMFLVPSPRDSYLNGRDHVRFNRKYLSIIIYCLNCINQGQCLVLALTVPLI